MNDYLTYGYWMGRYPVTNAQYMLFVEAGGYLEGRYWKEARSNDFWSTAGFKGEWDETPRIAPVRFSEPFGLSNHTVVGVSWYEAVAFCRWLTDHYR